MYLANKILEITASLYNLSHKCCILRLNWTLSEIVSEGENWLLISFGKEALHNTKKAKRNLELVISLYIYWFEMVNDTFTLLQ